MSVDRHSNGQDEGATRFELFEENELQRLKTEAARMISNGIITLEDCSLSARVEDGETLAEGENEAFRADVREELDNLPSNGATEEEKAEDGEGWGPTEVDYATIWQEYGFGKKVSNTQLVGALAYSKHTSFGKGGARRCIEYGVEAGELIDIPRYMPENDEGETPELTGVLYARGGDQ